MASLTLLILTNWDWDLFKLCWVGLGQGEGEGKHEVSTVASSNWLVRKTCSFHTRKLWVGSKEKNVKYDVSDSSRRHFLSRYQSGRLPSLLLASPNVGYRGNTGWTCSASSAGTTVQLMNCGPIVVLSALVPFPQALRVSP